MTEDIKLPPLPSGLELWNIGVSAPDGVGRAMQEYAIEAIEPYKQRIEELESQLEAIGAGGVTQGQRLIETASKHGTELITTDQAEAYAAAKVKEALLEAYGSMQELHMLVLNDTSHCVSPAQVASFAANRISALIPKMRSN